MTIAPKNMTGEQRMMFFQALVEREMRMVMIGPKNMIGEQRKTVTIISKNEREQKTMFPRPLA